MLARVLFVVSCCVLLASVANAQRGITYATCSASGDPHFTTFDGVYHDFQGEGTWVIVKGIQVEAHIQTLRCGGSAAKPVCCIRSVTIAFDDPEIPGLNATVKFGMWGGVPDNLIVNDGTTGAQTYGASGATALPKAGVTISGGRYIVTRSGNTVSVNPTVDPNSQYKRILAAFTISQYYFVSTIPSIWQGTVNGLCGFYDGSAANEFMDPVDTTHNYYSTPTVKGQRYNGAPTYTWGALWNVSSTGFAPLMSHFHAQHSPFEVQDVPPAPSVPNAAQQSTINTLAFDDITAIANIEQNCRDAHGDDRANFDNCMYDTAAAPNEVAIATSILSASVAQAALTGSDSTGSSSSDKTSLAVGLGVGFACLAVVSILVALFLYHRLRTVKAQYDKALITVQQQGGAGPTDSGEIRLSENI